MPYIRETCVAGCTVEINKYYTSRYHAKGEARSNKEQISSEAQKKVNQRKAAKDLRRLMNTNFRDGDLLVRLDFHKCPGIDSDQMQQLMSKAIRKMRAIFRKAKQELKYIYVKEVGPKGGRHVHMIMSRTQIETLTQCWPHGGIHIDPLNSNGQYSKIAEYFIKYAARTEATEGQLIGKRWYGSRNLKKPRIHKKVISAKKFKKEIKVKKGYFLDKDSVSEGVSMLTGYEYFSYTLIKTDKEGQGG